MIELQDIFLKHGDEYWQKHKLPFHVKKVIWNIISCRTSKLGGYMDECEECGHIKISYNSCRDRHWPKCQTLKKGKWIEDRKNDLLPVPYFHGLLLYSLYLKNYNF